MSAPALPFVITDASESTTIVVIVLLAVFLLSFRKSDQEGVFSIPVTQELKGLGILAVVFSHIAYMLVKGHSFLTPLAGVAGIGVDLFLFMSGYGLTVSLLKKPLSALEFYKRRLVKVMIPFWVVIILLFVADALVWDIHYSWGYLLQSVLGWFPRASAYEDVNSPFWYISWIIMYYALMPLLFNAEKPWITAIWLLLIVNLFTAFNPLDLQANWLHRLHSCAFPLGILQAWLLRETKGQENPVLERLRGFRNDSQGLGRYGILFAVFLFAWFWATHQNAGDWPGFAGLLSGMGFSESAVIGQGASLLAMMAVIFIFSMKKLENRFLYIFGVYSYETYLLHWPLMARYDVFFDWFPSWLAVLLWLAAFIGIGWLLQKVTTPLGAWIDSKW